MPRWLRSPPIQPMQPMQPTLPEPVCAGIGTGMAGSARSGALAACGMLAPCGIGGTGIERATGATGNAVTRPCATAPDAPEAA